MPCLLMEMPGHSEKLESQSSCKGVTLQGDKQHVAWHAGRRMQVRMKAAIYLNDTHFHNTNTIYLQSF